ncbi:MAG: hypothetical protein ACD_4C00459G0004 [uncultured bacterium (gcode 4)]|uniref:Phosphatidylglycerol--prolipoprotein diacylglyceryl transferase n=1 Tax=uncultured bacterium (gcode 4) TaxID=1234023 RepID=K2GRV0_9BACT|nr:MAG: hypothetical protein ACD_4C00459G0004 [uncultured bacterium (gcode 4)]
MKIFDITIFWIQIAPSYYGLAYALGFILGFYFLKKRKFLSEIDLENLVIYIFFWVILGWRIWYILFYNLDFYISNPFEILAFWHGWMSFHGWVIWVIIAMLIFSKVNNKNFFDISDNVVCALPIGLFLWRIWNYINKELLWKPYEWFLAVYKDWIWYFPSPLLEAFLEWIILFFLLNHFYRKRKYKWEIWWYFLFFYGIFRFSVEFIRIPDSQIWYVFWWLTLWQILSIPMIIIWIYFAYFFKKHPDEK